jgi:acetyl esterase/lipase
MTSIQANLLFGYLRLKNRLSPPSGAINLEKERARLEGYTRLFKPLVELKSQPVDVDGVPGEWLSPPQMDGKRTILYLHGGYYMFGSIRSHRSLAGNIAAAAQARVLIIDYRLAPEHPFPAGLEDALTAYRWLLAQDIQSKQIALAGDSAGGGLILSALLAMRQRGMALPASGVCLSPATNLNMKRDGLKINAKRDVMVNLSLAEQIQTLYLRGIDPCDPLASPYFGDLRGLPPLLIQVGADEILRPDCECFAEQALKSGVDVTLEVWPGMQHVWQYCASFVPESRQAIERIGEFIKGKGLLTV